MILKPRRLEKYATATGRCPYDDWHDSVRDKKTRARIDAYLLRVEQGSLQGCKPVGDGVKELVLDFGPGYRIYFGEDGDTVVILLCGGDKSSQAKDIETARSYWAEYRS